MYGQIVFYRGINQRIAEKLVVFVRGKDGLSIVAPLNNLLQLTGDDVTGKAGVTRCNNAAPAA